MSVLKVQNPPQTYSRLFRPWDSAAAQCNPNAASTAASSSASTKHSHNMKSEYFHPVRAAKTIKSERIDATEKKMEMEMETAEYTAQAEYKNMGEVECSSSESCFSNFSDESVMYQSHHQQCASESAASTTVGIDLFDSSAAIRSSSTAYATSPITSTTLPSHLFGAASAYESSHHHHHQQHQHHLTLFNTNVTSSAIPSDFYYSAATSATANGELSPPRPTSTTLPSTSSQAAVAAAAAAAAATANFMGMDVYTIGLMEQEYTRILTEEAQLKALNARKQRPKKFKCPHCDVAFSNNGQLKGHIRIHTGERPFKCDVESCGKTFTRNEELTRHKRIHTGLRPYPCPACGKKFGRRDHLKKHMKTHMPQERQLAPALFVPMYPYLYGY